MMSETQQHPEQTKTTSVTVTSTKVSAGPTLPAGLAINVPYLTSPLGICKFIILILSIICMACASPAVFGAQKFFLFVLSVCFIITFCLLLIHFITLPNVLPTVPWLIIELIYSVSAFGLHMLSSIIHMAVTGKYDIALHYAGYRDSYYAAGVIALIVALLYGATAFMLFKERRSATMTTTTTTTNVPA